MAGSTGWSDLDVYEYTSGGGELATIALARTGGGRYFEPVFDVVGPDGQLLQSGQTFLRLYPLTNAGVYQIIARDSDAYDAGTYEITLIRHPGSNLTDSGETNQITAGQTVAGSTGWSDLDVYEFDAISGDSLAIYLRRINGGRYFDPIFEVYAPDGTVIASGNRVQMDCLEQTGHFQIICRDSDLYDLGSYSLSMRQTPGLSPAGAPPDYLQALVCDNTVIVRWSTNTPGFRLERSDLVSPSSWLPVEPPYHSYSGYYYATNTSTNATGFFRLKKSN